MSKKGFNITPLIKEIDAIVGDNFDLDFLWSSLVDRCTEFGFIIDLQECRIFQSANPEYKIALRLHHEGLPSLEICWYKTSWIIGAEDGGFYLFERRKDGLYMRGQDGEHEKV